MSRDPRVDAYIERAQPFARSILEHVRARVHAAVPEVEETLKWGAPSFTLGGKILLVMAAFKAHAALNFWRGQEIGDGSPKAGAMGQFGKLTDLADLPDDATMDALVRQSAALAATTPVPRKAKHPPRPMPDTHPAFAAALTADRAAAANFEDFSPSQRREYLEWIADAKRDDTRAKRITTAIEWLRDGRKRNWKYENC